MINAHFTVEEFKKQPPDLRIGIVISDGMWYSLTKWRKIAKVSETEILKWIDTHLKNGMLLQSATGAKSYRFSHNSIKQWYSANNFTPGEQLIDFLFPPRIWAGLTETEGFLAAPLREIGIVSFTCSAKVAAVVTEALRGVARVRETEPNHYKAYCLDASHVKIIVEKIFTEYTEQHTGKIYSRGVAKRRELVDFPPEFSQGLIVFYQAFGRTLVKKMMETINIFLPDVEDQNTQVIMWVIAAVEKFDESTSVPFSGYLNSVLRRWPYDLPYLHLGKELSNFQRQRSRALESLRQTTGRKDFTSEELAQAIGITRHEFDGLEEKHKVWISTRSATPLTWSENGEEKVSENMIKGNVHATNIPTDIILANRLSSAVIQTALTSANFPDAFTIISQIDETNINLSKIREVSEDFIQILGTELGINGGK